MSSSDVEVACEIDCRCLKCNEIFEKRYQEWKDSVDRYVEQYNLPKFAKAFFQTPNYLLRLPRDRDVKND